MKWAAASSGSSRSSAPRSASRPKALASAAVAAAEAALVERPAELGKAADLADHKPAEREQARVEDGVELAPGEVAQVCLEIRASLELDAPLVDRVAGGVDGPEDDLREQLALVCEVLVHRLLRDAGPAGDGVHGRVAEAVPQKRLGGRVDDRLVLALGAGCRCGCHSPSVLDSPV